MCKSCGREVWYPIEGKTGLCFHCQAWVLSVMIQCDAGRRAIESMPEPELTKRNRQRAEADNYARYLNGKE